MTATAALSFGTPSTKYSMPPSVIASPGSVAAQ
jgi:hypothetical protein